MQLYEGWWRDHLPVEVHPFYDDFKVTLGYVWSHLGLPAPTAAQYRIADYLQGEEVDLAELKALGVNREDRRALSAYRRKPTPNTGRAEIIMAFRGIGKSFITAAFVLWRLLRDPRDEKILVVSASSSKAKEFVAQVKAVLMTSDLFEHLRPEEGQRNQADRFDVAGASISQSPSLKAAGITGQITGSRATLIVADDIEVPANSSTQEAREGLMRIVNEFDAIKVPASLDPDTGEVTRPAGDVVFLGTPQTLESIYLNLIKTRGFQALCIPARVPTADKLDGYEVRRDDGRVVSILDPFITYSLETQGLREWDPTDPKRFNEDDLRTRESRGRSWFMLQYMLDTSLSDAELYPLKTADLIVMGTNHRKAPATVQWGHDTDKGNILRDAPNVGFSGDKLLRPLFVDAEWRPYDQSVFFVDPSGRGKDETAWSHVRALNGQFYLIDNDGISGDVNRSMIEIAKRAKAQEATTILVEPNFAAGVWINAFLPVLNSVWPGGPRAEEADWSKNQKEQRIIDTLEPVLNTHRLVIDEGVLRRDLALADKDYSLLYQLTHISRQRGSLKHDDRLDSLAGAISALQKVLQVDGDQAWEALKEKELDDMLADFMENFRSPARRGYRRGQPMGTQGYERGVLRNGVRMEVLKTRTSL